MFASRRLARVHGEVSVEDANARVVPASKDEVHAPSERRWSSMFRVWHYLATQIGTLQESQVLKVQESLLLYKRVSEG